MHSVWSEIDRRLLIQIGTAGLAALALPGAARAMTAQGFTHGVASGEPAANSVLLWTRYAGAHDSDLRFEVAEADDFARIVAGGTVIAAAARDFCAKVTATDLAPGRWYFYRFIAPDGTKSATGRTRTLPGGRTNAFTIALFSCSNMGFGWFNAYAHAAARGDIDLVAHVGDYLYEYQRGDYPSLRQMVPGRDIQPSNEIVALADYRARYAGYRSDPDLQRLHQLFPMICQWDDHEFANDTWSGGAENHDPASEGDWGARKAAAEQAYREWLPVSDAPWRSYQIGDLATIFLPETRVSGRDKPFDLYTIADAAGDKAAGLKQFAETGWRDPARQLLGAAQEKWLFGAIDQSVKSGTRWQICAQQIIMGSLFSPLESADWFGASAPEIVKRRVETGLLAARAGLPFSMDAWDGYPAARNRLLGAVARADANFISLAGDSHNGWAFDLAHRGSAVGVEMAGHSVTSPGFESYARGVPEASMTSALIGSSPALRWANTAARGYVTVQIDRQKTVGNWHFVQGVRERSPVLSGSHAMTVRHGNRRYDAA